MTIITVNTPKGRLGPDQRRELAETLTDAVLVPEVGQHAPAARAGFQVHFVERERDMMAIGGRLLADAAPDLDVMVIDVAVMDAAWQRDVRAEVIERVLAALAAACGLEKPSPAWWVNFRVIDEGSWGSSGVYCRSCRSSKAGSSPRNGSGPSARHWARERGARRGARRGRGPQSQSRRLKITYRLTQTIPISPIANGYPNLQPNSGMWSKFIP